MGIRLRRHPRIFTMYDGRMKGPSCYHIYHHIFEARRGSDFMHARMIRTDHSKSRWGQLNYATLGLLSDHHKNHMTASSSETYRLILPKHATQMQRHYLSSQEIRSGLCSNLNYCSEVSHTYREISRLMRTLLMAEKGRE